MRRIHKSPKTKQGKRALQKSLNRHFKLEMPAGKRQEFLKKFYANKTSEQLIAMHEGKMLLKTGKHGSKAKGKKGQ